MRTPYLMLAISVPFLLLGCTGNTDPCTDIDQQLKGRYEGVAIALGDGNAWFAVPVDRGRCVIGVSGSFDLHEKIREASKHSAFRWEGVSPVYLEMDGEVYTKDNVPLFEDAEKTQSHWFKVEGQSHVSDAVSEAQWKQAFELQFGMTIEEREQWVQDYHANAE